MKNGRVLGQRSAGVLLPAFLFCLNGQLLSFFIFTQLNQNLRLQDVDSRIVS